MEDWQKEIVRQMRPKLIQETICSDILLAGLESVDVLHKEDVQEIKSEKTDIRKAGRLYGFLETRTRAYDKLLKLLNQEVQSGAVKLLQLQWDHLGEEFKAKHVLNKKVGFQNIKVELGKLLSIIPEINKGSLFTPEFLLKLLQSDEDKKPVILVKSSVPATPNYYIHRKINLRNHVNPQVFQAATQDIFAIEGIERYQLTNLTGGKGTKRSGELTESLDAQFVLLEMKGHFDKICSLAKTGVAVHWLSHNSGMFQWIRTHGSLQLIQRYLAVHETTMNEDGFLTEAESSTSPTCITDTPGMGKSMLLAKMALKVAAQHPEMLVVFLSLSEFIPKFNNNDISPESVSNLISEMISSDGVGQALVRQFLKQMSRSCFLFCDGFDEVLPNQVTLAKRLFQCLKKDLGVGLYVTTRPHKRHELEDVLGTLSYNMVPFQDDDQVDFLIKYWVDQGARKNVKLENYAHACLETLKGTINKLSVVEREIAGIPLQCTILAQVYQDYALICSKDSTAFEQPAHLNSLFHMYSLFMDNRFEKALKLNQLQRGVLLQEIENLHKFHAVNLLFPQLSEICRPFLVSSHSDEKLLTVGILETRGDSDAPKFVHRTFAEYLVAVLVVDLMSHKSNQDERQTLARRLFDLILETSDTLKTPLSPYDIIVQLDFPAFVFQNIFQCYFLNALLQSKPIEEQLLKSWSIDQIQFRKIFTASALSDYLAVAKFVTGLFKKSYGDGDQESGNLSDCLPWNELFVLAARYAGVEFMRHMSELLLPTSVTQLEYQSRPFIEGPVFVTPLLVAVQAGRYEIVEYLLTPYGSLIQEKHPSTRFLLNFCAHGSATDGTSVIQSKEDMIKLFCFGGNNRHLLEEKLEDRTPLLERNVHVKVLQALVEVGSKADVNLQTNQGCVLHTFVTRSVQYDPVGPEEYHQAVVAVTKAGFEKVDGFLHNGRSPLHAAVERLEVKPETIQVLLEKSPEIDKPSEDSVGESVLQCAVRHLRSMALIEKLASLGGKALDQQTNKAGETVLHTAAKQGYVLATKYFIAKFPNLNHVDNNLNNALHAAVSSHSIPHEEIQIALMQAGVNVSGSNRLLHTPFLHACINGSGALSLGVIKSMEEDGLHITAASATTALKGILAQIQRGSIELGDWNKEVKDVAEYLVTKKGGRPVEIPEEVRQDMERYSNMGTLDAEDFQQFATSPPEVEELKGAKGGMVPLVILSEDVDTTIKRLSDTQNFEVIKPIKLLETKRDRVGVAVIRVPTVKQAKEAVAIMDRRFKKLRFIIVLENTDESIPSDWNTLQDEFSWSDLSLEFQTQLASFVSRVFGGTEAVTPFLPLLNYSQLLVLLKSFREETPSVCTKVGGNWTYPIQVAPRVQLHPDIFNFYVPDLVAFRDWSEDELEFLANFGQMDEDKEVNFVIVDSDTNIEEIRDNCRKLQKSAHLVQVSDLNTTFTIEETLTGTKKNLSQWLQPGTPLEESKFFEDTSTQPISLLRLPKNDDMHRKLLLESLRRQDPSQMFVTVHFEDMKRDLDYFQNNPVSPSEALLTVICTDQLQRSLVEMLVLTHGLKMVILLNISKEDLFEEGNIFQLPRLSRFFTKTTTTFPSVRFWITFDSELSTLERWLGLGGYHLVEPVKTSEKVDIILKQFNDHNSSDVLAELIDRFEGAYPVPRYSPSFLVYFGLEQIEARLWSLAKDPAFYLEVLGNWWKASPESREAGQVNGSSLRNLMEIHIASLIEKGIFSNYLLPIAVHRHFPTCRILKIEADAKEMVMPLEMASYIIASRLLDGNEKWIEVSDLASFWSKTVLATKTIKCKLGNVPYFTHPILITFLSKLLTEKDAEVLKQLKTLSAGQLGSEVIPACVVGSHFELLKVVLEFMSQGGRKLGSLDNALGLAVIFGDVDTLKLLIKHCEAQVEQITFKIGDNSTSLLNLATRRGSRHIFNFLVSSGCSLLEPGLLHACVSNSVEDNPEVISDRVKIIDQVLATNDLGLNEKIENDRTPLLMNGIHLDLIRELINRGSEISSSDSNGSKLIHLAPTYLTPEEYQELAKFLVGKIKTSTFEGVNLDGFTLLHRAVLHIDVLPDTLKLFAAHGVDFNATTLKLGDTIFHTAVEGGGSARLLDKLNDRGANWMLVNSAKRNVLHTAALIGNSNAIEYFASVGSDINAKDDEGNSPLHLAFLGDPKPVLLETVRALVQNGADVNLKGSSDNSPLHTAVMENKSPNLLSTLRFLINNGADVSVKNANGRTMLHEAPQFLDSEEYTELISLFLESGLKAELQTRCDDHCTPLHHAVRHLELPESTLSLLVAHGDVNASDKNESPALFHAIEKRRSCTTLDLLVQFGADWTVSNKTGAGVFHIAACFSNLPALRYFIAKGDCDIHAKDSGNSTPLHYAFREPSEHTQNVVQVLLNSGADVTVVNSNKKTALDLALEGEKSGKVLLKTLDCLREAERQSGLSN